MVSFIGAGPGDPELLTIKGKKLIDSADVIIYAGSLVNPEVLRDHVLLRDTCDELDDTRFHQQELFDQWEKLVDEQDQYEQEEN